MITKEQVEQNRYETIYYKGTPLILMGLADRDGYAEVKKLRGTKTYIAELKDITLERPKSEDEIDHKQLEQGDYFAIGSNGKWKDGVYSFVKQKTQTKLIGINIVSNVETTIDVSFDFKKINL